MKEEQAPGRYDPQPALALVRGRLSLSTRLALQGLVGVAIATALDLGFAMDHGYWTTITAFLILSSSLGETLLRGQKRVLGTAIGVFAALAYIWVFGAAGNLVLGFLSALALGLVIVTMFRFWVMTAVGIGFMVISALHLVEGLQIDAMMARIYETAIGAVIGYWSRA